MGTEVHKPYCVCDVHLLQYGGVFPAGIVVGPGLEDVYGGHQYLPHPSGHAGRLTASLELLDELPIDGLHSEVELLDQTSLHHRLK